MRLFTRHIMALALCGAGTFLPVAGASANPAVPLPFGEPAPEPEPDPAAVVVARKVAPLLWTDLEVSKAMISLAFSEAVNSVTLSAPTRPEVLALERKARENFQSAFRDTSRSPAFEALTEARARALARQFPRDELEAILTFLQSKAGQRFFERFNSSLKGQELRAAERMYMQEGNALSARLLDDFRREHTALISAHPDWATEDVARRAAQQRQYDEDVKSGRLVPICAPSECRDASLSPKPRH